MSRITNRTAGYTYAEETFTVAIWGKQPYNIDVINAMSRKVSFSFKDDEGKSHDDGHINVERPQKSSRTNHVEEKKGIVAETIVRLTVPKGSEKAAMSSLKSMLKSKFKMKVEKSPNRKPQNRKATDMSKTAKELDRISSDIESMVRVSEYDSPKKFSPVDVARVAAAGLQKKSLSIPTKNHVDAIADAYTQFLIGDRSLAVKRINSMARHPIIDLEGIQDTPSEYNKFYDRLRNSIAQAIIKVSK